MDQNTDPLQNALEILREADSKLSKLKNLNPYFLDVSLRENSVGHPVGQTLQDKLDLLPQLYEFGFNHILLGALNYSLPEELSVDDDFIVHLKNAGFHFNGCFAFTSLGIKSPGGGFKPDPSQLKLTSYEVPHTIHEIYLCEKNRTDLYDVETLLRSLPESVQWLCENRSKKYVEPMQIFINIVDGCDAFIENPKFVIEVLQLIAKLPVTGLSFQDDRGTFLPFQVGAFTKIARQILPATQKILVHIHSGSGYENASVIEALLQGADGVWGALAKFGPVIGHASLGEIIANLIRIENSSMSQYQIQNLVPLIRKQENSTGAENSILSVDAYQLPLSFFKQTQGRAFDLTPEKIGETYSYRICPVISDPEVIAGRLAEITGKERADFPQAVLEMMQKLMRRGLRQGLRIVYNEPANLLRLYEDAKTSLS